MTEANKTNSIGQNTNLTDAKRLSMAKVDVRKGWNARKSGVGDIEALAADMKEHGQLTPIIVAPYEKGGDKFWVVAGHRRYAALASIGAPTVEAKIFTGDETAARILNILENEARKALTPYELALGFKELKDAGMSGEKVAKEFAAGGRQYSGSYVNNLVSALANLHPDVLTEWEKGSALLTTDFVNALKAETQEKQLAMFNEAKAKGGFARPKKEKTEKSARNPNENQRASKEALDGALHAAKQLKTSGKGAIKPEAKSALIEALRFALGAVPTLEFGGIEVYDHEKAKDEAKAARDAERKAKKAATKKDDGEESEDDGDED